MVCLQPPLYIYIVYKIFSCPSDNNFTIFPYCVILAYSLKFIFFLLSISVDHTNDSY